MARSPIAESYSVVNFFFVESYSESRLESEVRLDATALAYESPLPAALVMFDHAEFDEERPPRSPCIERFDVLPFSDFAAN